MKELMLYLMCFAAILLFGNIGFVIQRYVKPYLEDRLGEQQFNELIKITDMAVRAAEQFLKRSTGEEKKQYVIEYIRATFDFDFTEYDLDILIESAVNALKVREKIIDIA